MKIAEMDPSIKLADNDLEEEHATAKLTKYAKEKIVAKGHSTT